MGGNNTLKASNTVWWRKCICRGLYWWKLMIYHHIKYFPCKSILEISTHVCKTVTRREIAWYVTVHLGIISAIRGSSINSVFWNKKKNKIHKNFPEIMSFWKGWTEFQTGTSVNMLPLLLIFLLCFYVLARKYTPAFIHIEIGDGSLSQIAKPLLFPYSKSTLGLWYCFLCDIITMVT